MIRSIRIKLDTVENHVIWCRAPGGRNLPRGFAKSHDRQLCSERGDQVEMGDLYPVRLLALKSNFKEFGTRIQGFVWKHKIPVVPHKAVAEVSNIGNL